MGSAIKISFTVFSAFNITTGPPVYGRTKEEELTTEFKRRYTEVTE